MTTSLSIINRAAELIGYKDPDETLGGGESSSFLATLNSMVDAWKMRELYVYAITQLVQSVSGNPITIGSGATLNVERPTRIPAGGFFRSGGTDYGFDVVDRAQYEAFMTKTVSTPWPRYCYYEPSMATGSVYFYPALASTGELHLPIEQRIAAFADLATDYTLPPGFQAALEYSLAEELASGMRPLPELVAMKARNYRRGIERFEVPMLQSGFERPQGTILTGWQ